MPKTVDAPCVLCSVLRSSPGLKSLFAARFSCVHSVQSQCSRVSQVVFFCVCVCVCVCVCARGVGGADGGGGAGGVPA